jgi:hypothetical protein
MIIRFGMFIFTICVLMLTLHTISIGMTLAMITEENLDVQEWRINPMGSQAADAVYQRNAEFRNEIYNSDFWYTRWISTADTFVQLLVGFGLIALSGLLIYIWYLVIQSDIRYFKKKQAYRRQIRRAAHRREQTV